MVTPANGSFTIYYGGEDKLIGDSYNRHAYFQRTGFPVQVRADGESPFVAMNFRDFELVDAASLAEGLFDYTPPQGVPVMDLGAMAKSRRPQSDDSRD